jgi:arginyl-tRNA synthetase
MIKERITRLLEKVVSKESANLLEIFVPNNVEHGDYTTNIAMKLAMLIAAELKEKIDIVKSELIEKIEVVKPGYINLFLKEKVLVENIKEILKKKAQYGKNKRFKDKKVIIEYTDPNPFKELHIGHLFTNTVGESLSRLFEYSGAVVKRADYYGDVGMHVAKSIFGVLKMINGDMTQFKTLEKQSLKERIDFLGKAYAYGATRYEEDEKDGENIKDINYLVYLVGQEYLVENENWQPQVDYKQYVKDDNLYVKVKEIYNKGKKWSLENFERIYERLDTKFDYYYPESIVGEYGAKIVKEGLDKGIFEKSKGAVIFPGEKYGLHTRVFINSLGLPVYEAKDLGLAPTKYKDFSYDLSIISTGNEISEYFKVVLTALKLLKPELADKTLHLGHGMLKLKEGKMSSRTGKVIAGEWLLDKAEEKVRKVLTESENSYSSEEVLEISEKAGLGSVRYALLKQQIGKDIYFDFEKSITFSGDSGPYLQYTYARAKSILRKAKVNEEKFLFELSGKVALNKEELNILKKLIRFPEIVELATLNYSPNYVATYLNELAQLFNNFYVKHQVINNNLRLALTIAVSGVIKSGLHLLGIKTVEKM